MRDSPPNTCKIYKSIHTNALNTYKNVEYGRLYEYLHKIITRLSLQIFIYMSILPMEQNNS
jgi:hypothetical protein